MTPTRTAKPLLTVAGWWVFATAAFLAAGCTANLPPPAGPLGADRSANPAAIAAAESRTTDLTESRAERIRREGDLLFENPDCSGSAVIRSTAEAQPTTEATHFAYATGPYGVWWRARLDERPVFDTYQGAWNQASGRCVRTSGPTAPNCAVAKPWAHASDFLSYVPNDNRPDALLFPDWLFFPEKLRQ